MSNIVRGISTNNVAQGRSISLNSKTNNELDGMETDFSSTINQQINSFTDLSLRNIPTGRRTSNNLTLNNSIGIDDLYVNNNVSTTDIIDDVNNFNSNINNEFRVKIDVKDESIKKRISNAVKNASETYGVDANLILAVIQKESYFNPNATSKCGARGLMQIMPANLKYLGVKDAYNIEDNINGGTKLLKEYLNKYNNNIEMALMAYNGGPTSMAKRGVKSVNDLYKMPKETQNYVPAVMKIYKGN